MRTTFQVQIKPVDYPVTPGELEIQITRNGYQWQVVSLESDEAEAVAKAITDYVRSFAASHRTSTEGT